MKSNSQHSYSQAAETSIDNWIGVAAPDLSGNEEAYVVDAIRSSWISSTGPYLSRFELEFAAMCGSSSAIAVTNGTVALHLALLGLEVPRGAEVLVPSLTFVATANAVRYVGAEPVFVDVDPATWCIDPRRIEEAITPRTQGIVAVHLYGHPADMDAINEIAAKHGLWVVEDAAEAHGATYKDRPVGSLGVIGTFSFYGNKILTSGEGGAVTVDDSELEKRLRMLRGQGMDLSRRYYFPIIGYNFRMTNVAAAILCAQLERRSAIVARRNAIFLTYASHLRDIPGIGFQPRALWAVPAPWLFSITVDKAEFGLSRDELATTLEQSAIDSRPFFYPLHRLPPYEEEAKTRGDDLPVTDLLSTTGMNLPTFGSMSEVEIGRVTDVIRRAHASAR